MGAFHTLFAVGGRRGRVGRQAGGKAAQIFRIHARYYLHVTLMEIQNLPVKNVDGRADVFVVVTANDMIKTSKTIKDTDRPIWGDTDWRYKIESLDTNNINIELYRLPARAHENDELLAYVRQSVGPRALCLVVFDIHAH